MAYNLHIEHSGGYWESEKNRVSLNAWLEYCKSDASIELVDEVVGVNPKSGQTITVEAEGTGYWTDPASGKVFGVFFNTGRITFGSDDIQVLKAKEIAIHLGGLVVGDEGEQY